MDLQQFLPHGFYLHWDPALLSVMIIANAGIAFAYFIIPAALIFVVRKKQDLSYGWMHLLFAAFIILCGLTHIMRIWTLYESFYWTEAIIDSVTAIISLLTAFLLWPLILRALVHQSPAEIQMIKRAEDKFKVVVEAAPNGMLMVDQEGKITLVNNQIEKMFGYQREELLGQPIEILVPMKSRDKHPDYRKGFFADPQTRSMGAGRELFGLHKNGTQIPVEIGLNPLTTEIGQFVLASVIDITERKQANLAAQRLADIVNSSSDAIIGQTPEGMITSWNKSAEMLYGYRAEEAIGQHILMIVPPKYLEEERKIAEKTAHGEYIKNYETIRLHKDNIEVNVSMSISPVKTTDGIIVGASTIVRDITERKEAEEKIRKSEEQLRLLIEGVRDSALFLLDPTGNVVTWNIGAEHIYGYRDSEIIDKSFSCFYTKEDVENGAPEKVLSVAIDKGHYLGEGWRVKKDGSKFWADIIINTVRNSSGNLVGFSQVTRDRTERKMAEDELKEKNFQLKEKTSQLQEKTSQLQATNAELESFSYSVSHDLKAPLRAINGFVSFLLEDVKDKLEPKACEYLDIINKNTIKMGQLIEDLLVFSRAMRQQMTITKINMEELTNIVFSEEKATYTNRVLNLQLKPMPQTFGDRSMIKQLLVNLVSNAIKFTKDRATAEIEIGGYVQHNACVYYVKDNGIGFDMQFINKLFQPFQRLVTQKEYEGTGIGLALVQRILHKHGGKAWAEGQIDVGTTIYFALPLKED